MHLGMEYINTGQQTNFIRTHQQIYMKFTEVEASQLLIHVFMQSSQGKQTTGLDR